MKLFKPNVQKMQKKRDVCSLIKALGDNDPDMRKAAGRALGELGYEWAVGPICEALKNSRWQWRKEVPAEALGRIGTPAVELLCVLLKDQDVDSRRAAVEALGRIEDARATESLCGVLRDDNPAVRLAAAGALGKIGDVRAVGSLCKALKDRRKHTATYWAKETAVEACCAAAEALGEIGDVQAVDPLCKAIKKDRDSRVRRAAAKALGQIGDEQAVESLCEALKDRDVHCVAAGALGLIGNERAVESLCEAVRDCSSAAAEALDKIGAPADPAVQAWCAVAKKDWDRAVSLGGMAVEPLCKALLRDDKEHLRMDAARALGKIGDTRAVEPLGETLLKNGNWNVRRTAAEALGQMGDKRAAEPLWKALLKDGSRDVRQAAVEAIDRIGLPDPEFLKRKLERGLGFFKPNVQKMKKKEDMVGLIKALGNRKARDEAIMALVEIGEPAATLLGMVLEDGCSGCFVREGAAGTLGWIGGERALKSLTAVRDSSRDENLIKTVEEALRRLPLVALLKARWLAYSSLQMVEGRWETCVGLAGSGDVQASWESNPPKDIPVTEGGARIEAEFQKFRRIFPALAGIFLNVDDLDNCVESLFRCGGAVFANWTEGSKEPFAIGACGQTEDWKEYRLTSPSPEGFLSAARRLAKGPRAPQEGWLPPSVP